MSLYVTFITIILTECCWFTAHVAFVIITSAQKPVRAATSDWSFVSSPLSPLGVGGHLHGADMSIQTFLPLLFVVFSCEGQEVPTP